MRAPIAPKSSMLVTQGGARRPGGPHRQTQSREPVSHADIDWPNTTQFRPAGVEWSPSRSCPSSVSASVFNQATQSQVMGAAYFTVKVTIGPRRRSDVRAWEAFISQFADTRNRVRFWDWRFETPAGVAGGAPTINGAGQVGSVINTAGWTHGVAGQLLAGDYVGIDGQLRRVVGQVDSDGAGHATLLLDQPVRASPANGSAVVLTRPTTFSCARPKRRRAFSLDGAHHMGPTLEFMEVFA
jgi:hypothetical protein